jgi:hypothetical protein
VVEGCIANDLDNNRFFVIKFNKNNKAIIKQWVSASLRWKTGYGNYARKDKEKPPKHQP